MTRRHPLTKAIALAALLALKGVAGAQEDVIKPFRPGGAKPAEKPAAPPAAAEDAPKAVPLKPFKADGEIPKARPVPPVEEPPMEKPTAEKLPADPANSEEIPKAKPVAKPAPPEMTRPETQAAEESQEPGDIVVKPGVAPTSPDEVQLQFADGYYSRKMWREAVPEYERYLEQFPRAPALSRQGAYYRLAESYRQTGSINNAKANYEAILANFNGGDYVGYAAYRLATILYEEKDYRRAMPLYRRAGVRLTQPTLIAASKFFTGRCLEASGQKTEAKVTYEDLAKVVDGNPYRDACRLSVGRLLSDGKRYIDALAWLQPLSKDSANLQIKADALARCAQLFFETGKYDEALESLAAATGMEEAAPWKEDLQFLKFRILSSKKDYKEVIKEYTAGAGNALSLDNRLNVLVLVADAHIGLDQRDAAMALYNQITTEFSGTAQARDASYARLRMLYETRDQRLLDEVNRFLIENPTAPQVEKVSLMKAEALFTASDFQNAEPIYEVIVTKSKGLSGDFRGEAQFKLGWCRMQLRRYQQAIEAFNVFIKENPTHAKLPTAYAQRGSALMQLKQYSGAQKDFEILTTKFPTAREREFGLENLALMYGQIGDTGKMAATFEILLRDFPDTAAKAKANYWIGTEGFDRKEYKKAAPHLDAARKLDSEQFFERASLKLLGCFYGLEDVDATEKEVAFYKANKGKAETPADVIRWLGQKYFERNEFSKAVQYLSELVIRKEATAGDYLLLGRARVKLRSFKDAVDSFDAYLSVVKDPVTRIAGLIEKTSAQIDLQDWVGAEASIKEGLTLVPEGKYNGEFRLRAAEVEVGKGNELKAIQIFESIPVTLTDDDINPRALDRALQLHKKLGHDDKVKELDNTLRSRYPEYMQKKKTAQGER